jgi:hypothetical protein
MLRSLHEVSEMKTRVNRPRSDLQRVQWRPPTIRKLAAGSADAGPAFLTEGGSAS